MAGWSYGGVVVWRGGRIKRAGCNNGVIVWLSGRIKGVEVSTAWSYGGVAGYTTL